MAKLTLLFFVVLLSPAFAGKGILPPSNQCVVLIEASLAQGYRLTAPDKAFAEQLDKYLLRRQRHGADGAADHRHAVSTSTQRDAPQSVESRHLGETVWISNYGTPEQVVGRLKRLKEVVARDLDREPSGGVGFYRWEKKGLEKVISLADHMLSQAGSGGRVDPAKAIHRVKAGGVGGFFRGLFGSALDAYLLPGFDLRDRLVQIYHWRDRADHHIYLGFPLEDGRQVDLLFSEGVLSLYVWYP